MPVSTVTLLSLKVTLADFLASLSTSVVKPLVVSKVVRWIITPKTISADTLLYRNVHWDLLIILPDDRDLPNDLLDLVADRWTIKAGIPKKMIQGFHSRNQQLLYPKQSDIPALSSDAGSSPTADSAENLELSSQLHRWVRQFAQGDGKGAVSMLNLLAFKPGMKDTYIKYGTEFARTVGSKKGGVAKITALVVEDGGGDGIGSGAEEVEKATTAWDQIALAHYPSIRHFAEMLASEDYQAVNKKYRVPALKDTFILCTTELGLPHPGTPSKL